MDASKIALRHISIWQISDAQMIHFTSECFFFNFDFKRIKLIITKSPENYKLFLILEATTKSVL